MDAHQVVRRIVGVAVIQRKIRKTTEQVLRRGRLGEDLHLRRAGILARVKRAELEPQLARADRRGQRDGLRAVGVPEGTLDDRRLGVVKVNGVVFEDLEPPGRAAVVDHRRNRDRLFPGEHERGRKLRRVHHPDGAAVVAAAIGGHTSVGHFRGRVGGHAGGDLRPRRQVGVFGGRRRTGAVDGGRKEKQYGSFHGRSSSPMFLRFAIVSGITRHPFPT
jgi:hypothetical protein